MKKTTLKKIAFKEGVPLFFWSAKSFCTFKKHILTHRGLRASTDAHIDFTLGDEALAQ